MTGPGGARSDPGLPEPAPEAVAGRLRDVEARVEPEQIVDVWIFPPLRDLDASSEFVVLSRSVPDGRRRLYTAGLRRPAPGGAPREEGVGEGGAGDGEREPLDAPGSAAPIHEVTEHGVVPAERVPRLLERFRRRIGEEHEPRHVAIEGSRERWEALVPRSSEGEDGGAEGPGSEAEDVEMEGADP